MTPWGWPGRASDRLWLGLKGHTPVGCWPGVRALQVESLGPCDIMAAVRGPQTYQLWFLVDKPAGQGAGQPWAVSHSALEEREDIVAVVLGGRCGQPKPCRAASCLSLPRTPSSACSPWSSAEQRGGKVPTFRGSPAKRALCRGGCPGLSQTAAPAH